MVFGKIKDRFDNFRNMVKEVKDEVHREMLEEAARKDPELKQLLEEQGEKVNVLALEDHGNATLWDRRDEPNIDNEFARIREGLIPPLSYEEKLKRILNDQKTGTLFENGAKFEPVKEPGESHDLVTNSGMARYLELATGRVNTQGPGDYGISTLGYFTHFASGSGTASETSRFFRLVAENARVSMITDGFAEAHGSDGVYGGKFSTSTVTATITEAGVFDRQWGLARGPPTRWGDPAYTPDQYVLVNSPGRLLFRTSYGPKVAIPHIQFRTTYTLCQTISMISIA